MNIKNDDIVRMTGEAGGFDATPMFLKRFAELVAAHEREECAKVCAEIADANKNTVILQGAANCCAAAIRARSKA